MARPGESFEERIPCGMFGIEIDSVPRRTHPLSIEVLRFRRWPRHGTTRSRHVERISPLYAAPADTRWPGWPGWPEVQYLIEDRRKEK